MKVLVTGVAGQLGWDICKRLDGLGIENKGVDLVDFDLTDEEAVKAAIGAYKPTHVAHCAAYTAVDRAESEQALCSKVNVLATKYVAQACAQNNAELMYFSTDYVFDGSSKQTPWEVDDEKKPVNFYGLSKYNGELEILKEWDKFYTLRISWVFGKNGHNFVKTMLRLAGEGKQPRVVSDQWGAPTYTHDVAKLAVEMLKSGAYGTYHAPNAGECNWCGFAQEIFNHEGLDVHATPISTAEYPTAAARPLNSRLSVRTLTDAGFEPLPHYSDALDRFLREIKD